MYRPRARPHSLPPPSAADLHLAASTGVVSPTSREISEWAAHRSAIVDALRSRARETGKGTGRVRLLAFFRRARGG